MYSVVDRNTNTTIISNEEIFAVQGMANTYTFGGSTDSITVEYQANVDLKDKFWVLVTSLRRNSPIMVMY